MENTTELTDILNDLIKINNDRIEGYQKAITDAKDIDVDLRAVFTKQEEQSRKYVTELSTQVGKLNGQSDTGTTVSGKIYRTWMDVKSVFTGKDRQSVLDSCEYGEDAAQKAYESALADSAEIPADIRTLITEQKAGLKQSHDLIKGYRDANKKLAHS